MKLAALLSAVALLVFFTVPTYGADNAICPQFKAMDYGNGNAMYYSLRCPDSKTPVGYVQINTGPTFMGCSPTGCPSLIMAVKTAAALVDKKSKYYEAHKDLKDHGVDPHMGLFKLEPSVPGTVAIEVFHDPFKIALWKDDDATMAFNHKGTQVFAEAIALKITPKASPPLIVLCARQIATAVNAVPAKVTHHQDFVVEFDSELPNLAPVKAIGQLLLLK